ncbi:MipA/OmpV family protein [Pseudoalteromonas xiamenensis]|uniref:MipA/OmpV family protein n=1 Tax=Pseudoalteromonas xiamenensis TaxID=882626 RepID=UPI0027E4FE3E|nr:MipA/OmpV family protein [Pseudoalteromonas xiamenensis]WMN59624.1 MipA/OmpV family protein [Pseudoalteromonas xiamenensis]
MKKGAWILALSLSFSALAEEPCDLDTVPCQPVSSWQFSLAFGYGQIDNPLQGGTDFPLYVVPHVSYYGEKWFLENTEIGYTFSEHASFDVSAIVALNRQAAYFHRYHPSNVFAGFNDGALLVSDHEKTLPISVKTVAKRSLAVDAGLLMHWYPNDANKVRLTWLHDISGVYQGNHVDLNATHYFKSVFSQDDTLALGLGLSYQSAHLNNYYFGIGERDTNNPFDYIQLGSGVAYTTGISYRKPISPSLNLNVTLNYKKLNSAMVSSPLVVKSQTLDYFVSVSYAF